MKFPPAIGQQREPVTWQPAVPQTGFGLKLRQAGNHVVAINNYMIMSYIAISGLTIEPRLALWDKELHVIVTILCPFFRHYCSSQNRGFRTSQTKPLTVNENFLLTLCTILSFINLVR